MHRIPLLLVTTTLALGATAQAQECQITGLQNPFSQGVFGIAEWQGHYYDAGWFHLRRRPVTGGTWQTFGGGIQGSGGSTFAKPMVAFDGALAIGGSFFTAGGQSVNNICAWDGVSFSPLGSGFDAEVDELVVWDGKLVAGGEFTTRGDGGASLLHVAVYDPAVGEWQPLGDGLGNLPPGFSSAIWGLTVHQGDLYATGRFRSSGSTDVFGVARFNSGDNVWEPVGSGIPGMQNGNVGTAIASYGDLLWVSGWFQSIGGVSAPWMATWNGSEWAPVPSGPTRHCLNLTVFDGQLVGSGPFPFTLGGVEYDIASFDGQAWNPIGNTDVNWPSDVMANEDESGLLVGGTFSRFNGTFTGNSLLLECTFGGAVEFCTPADGHPENIASIAISAVDLSPGTNVSLSNGAPGRPGLLLVGAGDQIVPMPGGSPSDLCIAGGFLGRYAADIGVIDPSGALSIDISNSASGGPNFGLPGMGGSIEPGQTWHFQFWYRAGGSVSRLSSALEVTFE